MANISRRTFEALYGPPVPGLASHHNSPFWYEVSVLITLAHHYKATGVVEFGIHRGTTAKQILAHCPGIHRYTGIDVPHGYETTLPYQRREVPKTAGDLVKDPRVRVLTPTGGTSSLVVERDFPYPVDFCFVDDDHSYEGVKRSTEVADRLLAARGGVILWHDYGKGGKTQGITNYILERNRRIDCRERVIHVEKTSLCFEIVRPQMI